MPKKEWIYINLLKMKEYKYIYSRTNAGYIFVETRAYSSVGKVDVV